MFNIKWGLISGGAAFVLALVFGLLFGHVGFGTAILRALIFAAVFFVLGMGVYMLINSFIPELLVPDPVDNTEGIFSPESFGSNINITLGDTPGRESAGAWVSGDASNAALPEAESDSSDADEPGNIADLGSFKSKPAARKAVKDIDQTQPGDYTDNKGEGGFAAADIGMKDFSPDFPGFGPGSNSAEPDSVSFPDFSGAAPGSAGFSAFGDADPFFGDAFSTANTYGNSAGEDSLPERRVSGNKPHEMEGDFNPKEIAAGIRTVLETDKKG